MNIGTVTNRKKYIILVILLSLGESEMAKFDLAHLESMPVAEILEMRRSLEQELLKRATELQNQLDEIGLIAGGAIGGIRKSAAAPRYVDAASGQSWSGRGRMAGWLAEKIKAGAKKEDFLIGAEKPATAATPKKRGRKKKVA
jgi:DNA-binding protein H-NS